MELAAADRVYLDNRLPEKCFRGSERSELSEVPLSQLYSCTLTRPARDFQGSAR